MAIVFDNKGKFVCCGKRMVLTRTGAVCTVCERSHSREAVNEAARQLIIERQIEREQREREK